MTNIELSKLATVPYLDLSDTQGRFISSLTFHADNAWHMWVPAGNQLVKIKGWPAESTYFSAIPESPNDIYFHFMDFIAQRASFQELRKPISGIQDDIFNLAASLAKISHFHTTKNVIKSGASRMVVTEIEYLFSICRSVFDLLQEIAKELWDTVSLLDPAVQKRPLRSSFSEMVFFKGGKSTSEQLSQRFGLPDPLSSYYLRHADFFMTLREFRDNIVHRGSQVQSVFSGDNGFLIQRSLRPFSDMNIWREDEKEPNDLVPLMPAIGVIIYKTLMACEDFSATIESIIRFPSQIVPGMRFFMRSYFNDVFADVLRDAGKRLTPSSGEPLLEEATKSN